MEREQLNFYLQQVPQKELDDLRHRIESEALVELVQNPTPQTLLVPVSDPINAGSFIGGEALVCSSIVKVNGINGWSMVMDDNREKSVALAILDGAFAAEIKKEDIFSLAYQGKENIEAELRRTSAKVNSTRVSFDLL